MKKLFLSLCIASAVLTSCTNTEKENKEKLVEGDNYSINAGSVRVKWTAYKTTEKKPVGGEFTKIKLSNIPQGKSPEKAMIGLNFSIPVSSLFTNNDSRDSKLKRFFFGMMDNTELLSGSVTAVEGNNKEGHGVVDLKMNNVSCDLPFDYTIKNDEMKITSVLNIKSWKAEAALDSLNNVCYDLHKGSDGISKTWEEVAIDISGSFVTK